MLLKDSGLYKNEPRYSPRTMELQTIQNKIYEIHGQRGRRLQYIRHHSRKTLQLLRPDFRGILRGAENVG